MGPGNHEISVPRRPGPETAGNTVVMVLPQKPVSVLQARRDLALNTASSRGYEHERNSVTAYYAVMPPERLEANFSSSETFSRMITSTSVSYLPLLSAISASSYYRFIPPTLVSRSTGTSVYRRKAIESSRERSMRSIQFSKKSAAGSR
jgi:hypothetical protein